MGIKHSHCKEKNDTMHMCVDYKELNKRTVRDSYSLPRIDELLDCLSNKTFSILDMKSGYHQVEIKEDHKMYTAFTTGPPAYMNSIGYHLECVMHHPYTRYCA